MKKMKYILSLVIVIITMNQQAMALSKKWLKEKIRIIKSEEKSQNFDYAALISANAAIELVRLSRADQLVVKHQLQLTSQYEEKIIRTQTEGLKVKLFGGLISFNGSSVHQDTEMFLTNPTEVDQFPEAIEENRSQLESQIQAYLSRHQDDLIYAKAFAAKSVQLLLKNNQPQTSFAYQKTLKAVQVAQVMQFFGRQTVKFCTETKHLKYTNSLILEVFSFIGSGSYGLTEEFPEQNEFECSQQSSEIAVTDLELLTAEIGKLDVVLTNLSKKLSLKVLTEAKAPYYPVWGSEDFK